MTARGERCRFDADYTREVDGALHRFCGVHASTAHRGTVRVWRPRPVVEPSADRHRRHWTAEEDVVASDPDVPSAEAAVRLGRSERAVIQRRYRMELGRSDKGEQMKAAEEGPT